MESEKENRIMADEICHSLQRTALPSHHKQEARRQTQNQHRGSQRIPNGGGNNNNGGGNGRRYDDQQRISSSRSSSNGHSRNFDHSNNNSMKSNNGNSFKRHDQQGGTGGGYKRYNTHNNGHYHNNNNNNITTNVNNNKKIPFCFDVTEKDLMVCERTAEMMRDMYSRIVVDEDIISKIQQLAMSAQDFLQLQQENLAAFYEEKKRHDIEVWLSSCSEEEQKRYWERMQKS